MRKESEIVELAKIMAGEYLPVYLNNGEFKRLLGYAENLYNKGVRMPRQGGK